MEAINYAHDGQNMILTEDAQIVPGVSGNACYLPAGTGTIALQGNRNELSVSLWRQWDGVVESGAVRGIFRFKNIRVFFDNISDCLTIVINGFKAITDIKDDKEQSYWCFTFAKNNRFTVYKNGKEVYSLAAGNKPVETADGFIIGGGRTHATFDEVRVYKTVLKQGGINGLFYLVSKGTQVKQLEKIVQSATPKYLGVTKTVPTTRTVVITKGEKLGAQDANAGDWVLMSKTVGGWKCGVCYRWTGTLWVNLEPEYNYTEQYQAALYHICEIPELMQNTGHFGALFAKVLVVQKALIDKLLVNQAFIKNLVVQKLHIDSDDTTHQDFEIDVNERVGFLAKNNNAVIFSISPTGGAYFSGSVYAGPLELDNTPEKIPRYQKDTVSTLELVSYLYNKQHIPMAINIKGTVYTLRTVKLEETPKKPDGNITRENLKSTFENKNYYLHITENNGYRGYFVCDVYRHIKYSIISYILLSGDVKYEYQETTDWWEKIASDVYHSYLSEPIPKNSSNNAPSITYDNSKKENPIIHNINIEFSPSHKLFKLKGLPEKTAGLSKGSVYMENGFLKIV